METYSDQRTKLRAGVILSLLIVFVMACFGLVYFLGNLAKYQEAISARETQAALRGVNNPEQLDQALKQLPSNSILKLIALANRESIEIDALSQRLLNEAQPKGLSQPIDLGASSRSDLDALRRDLQIAQSNAATFEQGYIALVKAERDKVEREARSLKVGNDTIARFMAVIDEQDKEMMTLTSKVLAARAEYYSAYDKCAALLVREFGRYKVENGQFVFPFQNTADGYNRAAAAMAAAAKRVAELDGERASLRQSQFDRSKTLAER